MKVIELKLKETVCYLIPISNKYLLIDTGYEKHRNLMHKRLASMNISISDIDYVLLTHHHDDHTGLLNEIKDHNPSCRVILHANAVSLLKKGKNDTTHCKYINGKVGTMISIVKKLNKQWDFSFPPYKVGPSDIIIKEETTLNQIGINISGKIIYTPGHTDDSISLLLDNGNCFVGDAASNMLQVMGTKYCVILITDLNQYYKSWEKIIKENAKTIYPAHGKPFGIEKLKSNLYKNKEKQMVEVTK